MTEPSTFSVIRAKRAGRDVVIVVDTALNLDESDTYPWLLTLTLSIRRANAFGLCDDVESERLADVEDRLLFALDEDDYRYVGRVTGNERREVLIYASDPEQVTRDVRVRAEQAGQSIEVDQEHEPDWETYRSLVPARQT